MPRTPSIKREDAEHILGPAENLIVTSENRALLRKWATACGIASVKAYAMTNVELANLYHDIGPKATNMRHTPIAPVTASVTREQLDAAAGLAALIHAVAQTGFAPMDENRVRKIATELDELAAQNYAETAKRIVAEAVKDLTKTIRIEVNTPEGVNVLEGNQHEATAEVIQIASLAHPIMLVGPAGCGKTTIGEMTAKALGLNFYITSTVFDTHELMGFVDGHGHYHSTAFRKAFEFGGVWVADEIDAWDAAALLAANSALANGYVTFPDSETPVKRHADFRMIACANTYGHGADRIYVGRTELDAASLDRFAVIAIDYDRNLETHLCGGNIDWCVYVNRIRDQVTEKRIRHVVSTRAIIKGAEALAIGVDRKRVEEMYLFKGMSETDRKKLNSWN